jgi:L-rhamnose isomerase
MKRDRESANELRSDWCAEMNQIHIKSSFELAREIFGELGVDVVKAMDSANAIPISMHSWQGDDLLGFEGSTQLTGGIQATGNYPGRARNGDELRSDIDKALECIPGKMKVSLHALHAEKDARKVDRDEYDVTLFERWIAWVNERQLGLDFNPTFFSHPMMDGNFSLTSRNSSKRKFWIEHGKRCREIAAEIGGRTGKVCINNFWMPDGYKDIPADTVSLRESMIEALDEIFSQSYDKRLALDALESKLFGLGIESYTVANHEFSLMYCASRKKLYTLDAGHFHPTESVSTKLSSIMFFVEGALLHISRGVRWDSDHVVIWDDELQSIMNQIVHNGFESRIHVGLDYFDASINRIACWVIGVRNARKALLKAFLDPISAIRNAEREGNFSRRLALLEETKSLPFSSIWNYYCMTNQVPVGQSWLDTIQKYESEVADRR